MLARWLLVRCSVRHLDSRPNITRQRVEGVWGRSVSLKEKLCSIKVLAILLFLVLEPSLLSSPLSWYTNPSPHIFYAVNIKLRNFNCQAILCGSGMAGETICWVSPHFRMVQYRWQECKNRTYCQCDCVPGNICVLLYFFLCSLWTGYSSCALNLLPIYTVDMGCNHPAKLQCCLAVWN